MKMEKTRPNQFKIGSKLNKIDRKLDGLQTNSDTKEEGKEVKTRSKWEQNQGRRS